MQKPLGFVIPQSSRTTTDLQQELDNVADDIEAYLVYQLEKIAQGGQNDIEKMHLFQEHFSCFEAENNTNLI